MCGGKIGGTSHILVKRDGVTRVFKDQNHINDCKKKWGSAWITAHEFMENTKMRSNIEKQIESPGIKKITIGYLSKRNKKVRKLDEVSYRLLHFILYSSLFYSYLAKNISEVES